MDKSICVFGDSTAWGVWDTEKGGWVNRLWLSLAHGSEADNYFEIYNLSVSGGTTETILERFEKEAQARKANVIIFQTGGNDSSQDSKGNFKISPEKFSTNLKEIIVRAKAITNEIVFIGFKNVDEKMCHKRQVIKGEHKRCQEPLFGLPLFLSVISNPNFFKTLLVQLTLP